MPDDWEIKEHYAFPKQNIPSASSDVKILGDNLLPNIG